MGQSLSTPPEADHLTAAKAAFNQFYADEKRKQCLHIALLSAQLSAACDTFLLVSAYEAHSRQRIWAQLQATAVADVDRRTLLLRDEQASFVRQLNAGQLVTMLPRPPDLSEELGAKLQRIKDADDLLQLTGTRSMSIWDGPTTPLMFRSTEVPASGSPPVAAAEVSELPEVPQVPEVSAVPAPVAKQPSNDVFNRMQSTMNWTDNGDDNVVPVEDDLSLIESMPEAPPASPASEPEDAPAAAAAAPAAESRHNRSLSVRSLRTIAEYVVFRDSVRGPLNVLRYCEAEMLRKPAKPAFQAWPKRYATQDVLRGIAYLGPRMARTLDRELMNRYLKRP